MSSPSKTPFSSLAAELSFSKYQGLGNDFLMLDGRSASDADFVFGLTPELVVELCDGRTWQIDTLAGRIVPELLPDGTIRVDMGAPFLEPQHVPTTLEVGPAGLPQGNLDVDGEVFAVAAAGMGNPHVVIPVPLVEEIDLERFGALLEGPPWPAARALAPPWWPATAWACQSVALAWICPAAPCRSIGMPAAARCSWTVPPSTSSMP